MGKGGIDYHALIAGLAIPGEGEKQVTPHLGLSKDLLAANPRQTVLPPMLRFGAASEHTGKPEL